MPTRNVNLTAEQDAFIDEVIQAGAYQNASEVLRDALRALRQRQAEDALKLEALRAQIDLGVAALEQGAFTEVDDAGLDAFLDGLTAPAAR